MTTVTMARRPRKRAETRRRILAAAIDVFSERGIERATVDEIAAAADVGKGTIYNYFATKEDIVVAFLADVERDVQQQVEHVADSDAKLEAILTTFVRSQLDLKARYHPFVRVFLAQMFARTDAFLPWMQELQTVIDPPLERLFDRLAERGLLRADVDLSLLVQVFKTTQLGLTALWAVEGPPWAGTERVIDEQIRLLCRGLGRRTQSCARRSRV